MSELDVEIVEQVVQEILTRAQFRKWPAPEVAVALARAAGALAGRAAENEEQLGMSLIGLAGLMGDQAGVDFCQRKQATPH